jgi:hypothetical protein
MKTQALILALLVLTACTRSASEPLIAIEASETPTLAPATLAPTEPPEVVLLATEELKESPTPDPATATASPTAGPPSETPTASSTPTALPFNPTGEYGSPSLVDSFSDNRYWADADGNLPDTDFIQLALGSGQLHVTGKPPQFDTWWFTSTSANNYFIEMQINTDDCSGRQAYGLILRGPESNTSARGYILTFSCDGAYRLVRLDGLNPYAAAELIPWTIAPAINAGANQSNLLGVSLIGDVISIYANQSLLEDFEDDTFSSGRFGLFVNAGSPGDFTYRIEELAVWNLD